MAPLLLEPANEKVQKNFDPKSVSFGGFRDPRAFFPTQKRARAGAKQNYEFDPPKV